MHGSDWHGFAGIQSVHRYRDADSVGADGLLVEDFGFSLSGVWMERLQPGGVRGIGVGDSMKLNISIRKIFSNYN